MKRRLQGLIAGLIIGVLLTGGAAYAKQATETMEVIYDNIKILIDGKEYQPTDVNGNIVEPFIYNGTTFLPVRAIANAFDKDVDWEPQTSTVVLGSKNYDWLDQMGYVDYDTTGVGNSFKAISAGTQAKDGIKYDRGIYLYLDDSTYYKGTRVNNDGTMECYQSVSYLLNGKYKDFSGIITALGSTDGGSCQLKFYGDGELIYSSPVVSEGTKSTDFKVGVSDIKILKVSAVYQNVRNSEREVCAALADARLSKK